MIFQPVFLWAFQAFIPSTLGLTGATTNTGPGMAPYENPGNHSNVQAQMESFVGQLRSLIYHTHFNYPKFEANAEVLDKQVSHITASFNEVSPRTKHLSNQFRFTTKLFETMAVAAKYIRSKNMFGEPYCSMVREICDLHVTVLTMFNSHGLPDKSISDYSKKVAHFSGRLRRFSDENLKVLFSAQPQVIMLVWNHFSRAENALQILESKK